MQRVSRQLVVVGPTATDVSRHVPVFHVVLCVRPEPLPPLPPLLPLLLYWMATSSQQARIVSCLVALSHRFVFLAASRRAWCLRCGCLAAAWSWPVLSASSCS